MRLPIQLLSLALAILPSTLAVFADEAYTTDYHHQLVGVPLPHTTFFHRPQRDEKASLLYTLSDQGVLGAVNPGNGAVVWRQYLAANTNRTFAGENAIQGFLRAAEGQSTVTSAIGGYVNAWDAITGREKWYNEFDGWARDLEVLESVGDKTEESDVLVLFEHKGKAVLRRLSGKSGDVVWEFAEDGVNVPFQVSTNVKSVFLVSLHGSRGSYNLRITTLDPPTGKRLDEHTLSTKAEVHGPEDILFVGANAAAPIIAWTDKGMKNLKINLLGTKQIQSLSLGGATEDVVKVAIHAPHLVQSLPHFLVHTQSATSHWADVYHIDLVGGTVAEAYHLPKLPGKGAFSTSSQEANVYFTRNTDDEVIIVSSASHGVLGRWPIKAENGAGLALHGVSEVVSKSATTYAVRSAVVTTEDNWVMIRNGASAWSRVEGLSGAVAAAWAEIPEAEDLAKTLEAEAHSNPMAAYVHRVNRHISDLKYLPSYLQRLPMRFLSSLLPADTSAVPAGPLARDNFGFRKLVIVATQRGRVYGLDTANQGAVVWSAKAFDIPEGEKWDVKGMFVDNGKGVVTIRGKDGEHVLLKTLDGTNVETVSKGSFPPLQSSALVDSALGKWLLPVAIGGDLSNVLKDWAPKGTLVVRGKDNDVKGLKYATKDSEAVPATVWTFQPTAGQRIVSLTARPAHDPVASIGRALSDRSVMYKYLNPNSILVTAVSDAASVVSFYLLDSVSGDVLYSTTHERVDTKQPITSILTENWFAYSLFSDVAVSATMPSSKGHQIIISELYESAFKNDRGALGSASNYSSLEPSSDPFDEPSLPHVVTQAFLIPEPISHMSVTQTRQGITSRQLLCTLSSSNSIVAIPRTLLDPRRPVDRDPTAGENEEGLIRYNPVIEFDPKMMITHQREVIGIKNVMTSPALLESTSLVFAYGVDVFGTRLTPSMAFDLLGKGFNRLALVGTVTLLAAGVGALAPMVRRKQINGRWKTA